VTSSAFQRIGHGGASALARANTLSSFDAAREIGVDMVEFDLRSCRGELVLAHTHLDARRRGGVRLDAALAHLAGPKFDGIGLNVDVKELGCEARLLAGLSRAGLLERTLVSSQVPAILDRVRALEPRARTGISIGGRVARTARRWNDWRAQVLAGLAASRWDTVMVQHRQIDRRLLHDVLHLDGLLYAWTVNDRAAIEGLRLLGVHGISTADPRLFT